MRSIKKIIHIIDSLQTGGAEVLLTATIKKLPHIEHHIIILESKNAYPEISKYANIYKLNYKGWANVFIACRRIREIVKTVDPDIVHSHLFLSSLLTRLALGDNNRIVFTLHTTYSDDIFKQLHLNLMEKYVYREQHKLIAVSNYVLEDYKRTITKCKGGFVVHNFVNDNFFWKKDCGDCRG